MARSTRTPRPAQTFQVTHQLATRTDGTETVLIPGMVVTAAQLQALVDDVKIGGVHAIWCDVCGDMLDHCPITRAVVSGWPSDDDWPTFVMEAQARRYPTA